MLRKLTPRSTGSPCIFAGDDALDISAFAPKSNGKRIVTASYDGTARLWDGETGQPVGEPMITQH
jgi:WD40 repeat protein